MIQEENCKEKNFIFCLFGNGNKLSNKNLEKIKYEKD